MTSDFCEKFISGIHLLVDSLTLIALQNIFILQYQEYKIESVLSVERIDINDKDF